MSGRRPRNAEATSRAILDAAEELFLERGFGQVSMSDLAAHARVTQSLIHHHFGTKAGLWDAVKQRRLAELSKVADAGHGADQADVRRLTEDFFHAVRDNPRLVRLVQWMHLEPADGHGAAEGEPEALARATAVIADAQADGTLRPDIRPEHVLIAVHCLTLHWFAARADYLRLLGAPDDGGRADRDWLEAMRRMLFEGLLPRPSPKKRLQRTTPRRRRPGSGGVR